MDVRAFCSNIPHLKGKSAIKKRHLEILGYRVIQVWSSHVIQPLNRHGGVGRARRVYDPRDGWSAAGSTSLAVASMVPVLYLGGV